MSRAPPPAQGVVQQVDPARRLELGGGLGLAPRDPSRPQRPSYRLEYHSGNSVECITDRRFSRGDVLYSPNCTPEMLIVQIILISTMWTSKRFSVRNISGLVTGPNHLQMHTMLGIWSDSMVGLTGLRCSNFQHTAQLLSHFCQFTNNPSRTRQRVEQPKIKVNPTQLS